MSQPFGLQRMFYIFLSLFVTLTFPYTHRHSIFTCGMVPLHFEERDRLYCAHHLDLIIFTFSKSMCYMKFGNSQPREFNEMNVTWSTSHAHLYTFNFQRFTNANKNYLNSTHFHYFSMSTVRISWKCRQYFTWYKCWLNDGAKQKPWYKKRRIFFN